MFKNQSIAKRLKKAFLGASLLVALSGLIGVTVVHIIGECADQILLEKQPIVSNALLLSVAVNAEMLALHSHLLGEKDALTHMDEWSKKADTAMDSLTPLIAETEDQQMLTDIRATHEKLDKLSSEINKLPETEAGHAQKMELMNTLETDVDQMLADTGKLIANSEADMNQSMKDADAVENQSLAALIVVTLLAFTASFWLGQRISRGIIQPLNTLVDYSKQVASGDLSKKIALEDTEDEVGTLVKAFQAMIGNLRQQLQEIADGTGVIASSVAEMSASSAQLASSSAENASAINETTTTVEEVRQTTELASSKAGQMAEEARHIKEISKQGRKATDDTVESMNKIQNQMGAIAETIIRLSEQSQAIGQIIATVDSLSEQSNVLAVNASIEAAKAGEHGKGFSVVAQEVKSLAQQSKQATMQVRNILNEIQKATSTAVATEQGGKVVEKGTDTAGQAGQAIMNLTEGLDHSSDAAAQIASASQQQRIGMDQITAAMESVREASQQNAASARQLEGAVHGLKQLGDKLKGIVSSYRI